MDIEKYFKNSLIRIIVKPNSPKTKIINWDTNKEALQIEVAAAPDKDKANKEIIKFFSKLLKKKVEIKIGMRSREKVLKII